MKNKIIVLVVSGWLGLFSACDYLDVVPDNIATIDNAFSSRTMAEKYLFTCYYNIPGRGTPISTTALFLADEFWLVYPRPGSFSEEIYESFETIARGNQNIVDPAFNYWDGRANNGINLFVGLRNCNLFLERMNNDIPGLNDFEKKRWISEVTFLKAYYHYWLLRMYGPIPLIRENLPISASVEEVLVKREPVDVCFDYIDQLLDEAIPDLPLTLNRETTEKGRVTQPIAMAIKAKVLVEAASPLFNGNTDYAGFKRKDDVQYFNQTYENSKWEKAATACLNAIATCHQAGFSLFEYHPSFTENLTPELITQMSVRNSVTEYNSNINPEIVWSNPNSSTYNLQRFTTAHFTNAMLSNAGVVPIMGVPLKIAEMFYTSGGVPMEEDDEWESSGKYAGRYQVRTATNDERYNFIVGAQTATLNFDRETRFYANLAFDGGLWYGIGNFDSNNQWQVTAKKGDPANSGSVTGYYCKKLAHYQNVIVSGDGAPYTVVDYPMVDIRLADLYLLCSEALNEAYGPSPEAYQWIDLVRYRAGLDGVEASWRQNARAQYKAKPTTREGFRDIIQRERLIELAGEAHRYWEIRRWKRAQEIWHNQPIQGWDIDQSETATYYRVRNIFTPQFTFKDYFWPIRENNLTVNPNLDQNPGW